LQVQPSWNRLQIRAKEPDSAIIFAHYLKSEKHLKLFRIPSRLFHSHEAGVLISRIRQTLRFEGVRFFS
jgi:hypothetical protein